MIDKNLAERMKLANIKQTKQRLAILTVMQDSQQPLTVDQIYNNLIKKDITLDLSTIYRFLDLLTTKNLVIKINNIQDERHLYEINDGYHRHYLCCLECNKIIAVKHCPLEDYEKSLAQETEFKIVTHKLSVYGYCPECAKKRRK
ncbi:MAG: Fur family transcriptional regulator [Erysipelotrichaceae bacterium]|nr:Fur family transcriptional regulator [Erysipelotrichaceae bacterium]MDD3923866.1 Fur family transcriptional regulator [Erysipelotrichaceae bacterium]MDD4641918.1 Fur family transcriptional regulator [Erysipelotrichaceae bacterium]